MKAVSLCCPALCFVLAIGCTCSKPQAVRHEPEEYSSLHTLPHFSEQEVQRLLILAEGDSGEAAYTLSRYYATEGRNGDLARKFEEKALSLDYPVALYRAAFYEWASAQNPNVERIEGRARKALELGFANARGLLEEVEYYRKAGVIPSRTSIRLVLPKNTEG